MPFEYLNHSDLCKEIQNRSQSVKVQRGIQPSIEMYEAVIIILVTGLLSFLVAWLFSAVRRHVYKDEQDRFDTSFDAGGNVNSGLTATTVISQWTWSATLLQSSTVAAKYGISGSFWYAAGATIQIIIFSMLAVQIKIRAPGAKTFLQVVRARFGKSSHIVYCCYALVTNIVVTAMLMLGGSVVITSLVKSISVEYAITLIAVIIGGCTFIGGLGAQLYISYFTSVIIYAMVAIFIYKVYEDEGGNSSNVLGQAYKIFDLVSCAKGPDGNMEWSYLTIVSEQGLMFGLINIVGNFGAVFINQSYWQSAIAAKPKQSVIGFILGGLCWFAIPFSFSTAMGLAYLALSTEQGEDLLNDDQVNSGLIAPTVAYHLMGKSGQLIIMSMILLTAANTASAEVIAVTSIVIYDIYAIYLKPYRLTTDTNSCMLCGKGRGRMANLRDKCVCISMTCCVKCHHDTRSRTECRRAIKPDYTCVVHSKYRIYNDYLRALTSWTIMWTTMAIIPATIVLHMIEASLSWVYLFMGILIGSAVIPISLTMFWERLTSEGMLAGTIGGTLLALSVWLGVASTYEGGLSDWTTNTEQELAMLSGNITAIFGGGIITVIGSLMTNKNYDQSMRAEIWENTRDIDNPLSPWMEKYQKELHLTGSEVLENRPSLVDFKAAFKGENTLAYTMSMMISVILLVIWPTSAIGVGVMSQQQFQGWVTLSEVWAFLAMIVITLWPIINEIWDIWSHFTAKRKIANLNTRELCISYSGNLVEENYVSNPTTASDVL